jgi:hypothetical protein
MKSKDLLAARKNAEEAVADMADGPLRVKAFEVILQSLLSSPASDQESENVPRATRPVPRDAPSSVAARIDSLAEEGFFSEPRSLGEIQDSLRQHGWHYPQGNLSTPLIRLVRQRRLRRLQLADGNKTVWKYSLP